MFPILILAAEALAGTVAIKAAATALFGAKVVSTQRSLSDATERQMSGDIEVQLEEKILDNLEEKLGKDASKMVFGMSRSAYLRGLRKNPDFMQLKLPPELVPGYRKYAGTYILTRREEALVFLFVMRAQAKAGEGTIGQLIDMASKATGVNPAFIDNDLFGDKSLNETLEGSMALLKSLTARRMQSSAIRGRLAAATSEQKRHG